MNENISRLMDGEVDSNEIDVVCAVLKRQDAMATWTCYHVIGDAMRGAGGPRAGFADRFAQRFAAEPTLLAPSRRSSSTIATWSWAIAATLAAVTVVGWTASSLLADTPAAVAKATEATAVSAARVRASTIPADYLSAHQEYSPAAAIQGVGPYLRAVATPGGDRP
ncbi:MAG TPA: sigma-E factor negative regulatory protein [Casimicrobiaceae bacterium]